MSIYSKLAVLCAVPGLAAGIAACASSTSPQSEPAVSATTEVVPTAPRTVVVQSEPDATAVATTTVRPEVSPDEQCPGSEFKVEQFIGSWQEVGDPTVTTLSQHGSLESDSGSQKEFGTWQFTPWDTTPAKSSKPSSAPNSCVLWLHWIADTGNLDLVYLPLEITDTSIQLSYVGRGNTVDWQRTTAR
ncbi:hypothetical protein [Mycobacterium sp. 155]|uniref:hypothetical protein n=1 Tax=Mycobacterium sp. 155 TaxID=1157943 RepID=UPI0003764B20|nr:hypothetical protein [Mycobacterium sp. 155]